MDGWMDAWVGGCVSGWTKGEWHVVENHFGPLAWLLDQSIGNRLAVDGVGERSPVADVVGL